MGEQWHVLNPAGLPDAPDFPNRLLFALGGLGAGLLLGIGRALWPNLKVETEPHAAIHPDDSVVLPVRRGNTTE